MRERVRQAVASVPTERRELLLGAFGTVDEEDGIPSELVPFLWGEETDEAFVDGHAPLTAAGVRREKAMMDGLLAGGAFTDDDAPEDEIWWSADWWPFMADGMGQLICWDARTGRVLAFLHDEPMRDTYADDLDGFLSWLDSADVEWRDGLGFMDRSFLAQVDQLAAPRPEAPTGDRRVLIAIVLLMLVFAVLATALELSR